MQIKVMDKVLAANDVWAGEVRKLLSEQKIKLYNLIGSPGAGKTTLLERTIDALGSSLRIGVIEGDIATSRDAERIGKKGVAVYQINTGSTCHLDAHMVHKALLEILKQSKFDLVFVENVGNLVCPAEFDIGEDAKIAVLSVTEGDDKVEKYPLLFSEARAMAVTKLALLKNTNFDLTAAKAAFRKLNAEAPIFELDSLSGEGFAAWIDFLRS